MASVYPVTASDQWELKQLEAKVKEAHDQRRKQNELCTSLEQELSEAKKKVLSSMKLASDGTFTGDFKYVVWY